MNARMDAVLPTGRFAGQTARERVLPSVRLLETSYAPGEVLPRHAHERAHLCFVLDGSYTETLPASSNRRDALSVMYLPEDVPHEERHHTTGRHFLMELVGPSADLHGDDGAPREAVALGGPGALLAARLYGAFRSDDGVDAVAADLTWELLALCRQPRYRDHPAWLRRTRDSIRERFRDPLRLDTLAAEASVHPVHLAQSFRRVYGTTVGGFIRQLRVEHACRELIRGQMALSDIAFDAGFADQSHLTRGFRSAIGMTPGEYRRVSRNSARPKGVQDGD